MKRRKTLNKYRVGEQGQIEKKNVSLSPRTRKLFDLMMMASMVNSMTSVSVDSDELNDIINDEDYNNSEVENCTSSEEKKETE